MTNIQVENVSDIKKKVSFEIPQERVLEVMDAQYKDLKKTVQIKGFRRGKVPMEILRIHFKSQVQADAARQIIEETMSPGLEEQKIKPVSVVNIDSDGVEEGKPFKFIAEIEVLPPLEIQGYKDLELKKYIRNVTDAQVEEQLNHLRERHARLAPLPEGTKVAAGHHLVVDIKAEVDGSAYPALTVTDYHLEVGRNFYLPDFDTHLEGMGVEESKHISLDLPENFPRKQIAGKQAEFEVTVKEAKEMVLPDLDDDFAKDLGQFDTLDALKEEIGQDLRKMLDSQSDKEMDAQIIEQLLERNTFDVPESMVEGQVDYVLQESLRGLAAQGLDPKRFPINTPEYRDHVRPAATRSVQRSLILSAISEQEKIEVTDDDVQAAIAKKADDLNMSADYLKDQLERDNRIGEVRAGLLDEKVLKLIVESARITEEEPPKKSEKPETPEVAEAAEPEPAKE
jgi:trigger factor